MKPAWALAAIAVILATACSNKPPEISRVYARVIYQHDPSSGASTEGLSVFLVASDPDGTENLSAFYVIDDDAQLFWKVDNTTWISSTAEGETWIGSNMIAMPGPAHLPSGAYRVLLQNAGGDTVEEAFTVPPRPVSASEAKYPAATVTDGAIHVTGSYLNVDVWTYGKDGKFVASFPASQKAPLTLASIAASNPVLAQGFTFRLFAGSARDAFNVVTGPYSSGQMPNAAGAQPAASSPAPAPVPAPAAPQTLPAH